MSRSLVVSFMALLAAIAAMAAFGLATTRDDSIVHASLDDLRVDLVQFLPDQDIFLVYNDGDPLALHADAQHLNHDVEWCEQAEMFMAPAHGEMFDPRGYYYAGPAQRGLDRYGLHVTGGGDITIDLEERIEGPARGEGPAHEPTGPLCFRAP